MTVPSRLFLCAFLLAILIGLTLSSPLLHGHPHHEKLAAVSSTGRGNDITSGSLEINARNGKMNYDSVDAELDNNSPRLRTEHEYSKRWSKISDGSKNGARKTHPAEKKSANLLVTLQRNYCCYICQGAWCACCSGGS